MSFKKIDGVFIELQKASDIVDYEVYTTFERGH